MDFEEFLDSAFDTLDKGVAGVSRAFSNSKLYKRYEGSADPVEQMLNDAGNAVGNICDKVSEKAEPAIQNIRNRAYNSFYDSYRKAGEPYGSGDEGFRRWRGERRDRILKKAESTAGDAAAAVKNGFSRVKGSVQNMNYSGQQTQAEGQQAAQESDPIEKPEG